MGPARILLLPGWLNSGPAHWQSQWERAFGYQRVDQHDWTRPLRGDWVARLQEVVLAQEPQTGIVLVAHSLGCLLAAAWAAASPCARRVKAALLVAPCDPRREDLAARLASWSPVVLQRLPFPSALLGSRNDPYCGFETAQMFADAWGSQWQDCGPAGHINADSGLGLWPDGHDRLRRLCKDIV